MSTLEILKHNEYEEIFAVNNFRITTLHGKIINIQRFSQDCLLEMEFYQVENVCEIGHVLKGCVAWYLVITKTGYYVTKCLPVVQLRLEEGAQVFKILKEYSVVKDLEQNYLHFI